MATLDEQHEQQGLPFSNAGVVKQLYHYQEQQQLLLPALEEDPNVLLSLGHALARSCCTEEVLQPIANTVRVLFPSAVFLSVEVPVLPQVMLSIQNLVHPGSCNLYFLHERNTLAGSCYMRRSCVSARQPQGGRVHSLLDIDVETKAWNTELHVCLPIPHVTQQSLLLLVGAAKGSEADPLTRADLLLSAYMEMCASVPCIGVLSFGMARSHCAGTRELANLALLAAAISPYLASDWQTFLDIATNSMTRHSLRVHSTGPARAENKLLSGNDYAAGPLLNAALARTAVANPNGARAVNGGAFGGPVGSSDYTNEQGSDSMESDSDEEEDDALDDTYDSGYDSEFDDSMVTDAGFDGKHKYANDYQDDSDSMVSHRRRSTAVLPPQRGTVLPAAGEASGETDGVRDVAMGDAPPQEGDIRDAPSQGAGRSSQAGGSSCAVDSMGTFRRPFRDDDPESSGGGGSGSGPSGSTSQGQSSIGGQSLSGGASSSTTRGSSHTAGHKQRSFVPPTDQDASSSSPEAAVDDASIATEAGASTAITPSANAVDVGAGSSAAAAASSACPADAGAAATVAAGLYSGVDDSTHLDAFYSSGDEPSCKGGSRLGGSKGAMGPAEGRVELIPAAEPPRMLCRLGGFITRYADWDLELRFRSFFAQQYRMNDVLSIVVQLLPLVMLMMCSMVWPLAVALANIALFVVLPSINRPWYERHRDIVCSIRALLHIICSQTCVGTALAATTSDGTALVSPGNAALLITTSGATSLLYFGLLPMRPGPLIGVGIAQLAVTLTALPQMCEGAWATAAGGLCAAKVLAVLAMAGAAPAAVICVTCERYMRSVFSQRVAAEGATVRRVAAPGADTAAGQPTEAAASAALMREGAAAAGSDIAAQ